MEVGSPRGLPCPIPPAQVRHVALCMFWVPMYLCMCMNHVPRSVCTRVHAYASTQAPRNTTAPAEGPTCRHARRASRPHLPAKDAPLGMSARTCVRKTCLQACMQRNSRRRNKKKTSERMIETLLLRLMSSLSETKR